ncbi:MAG: hypothetical protein E6H07_05195 [Bacteroidetes bacterium]|nr:MAG: hypothetical protein E6H07_05195 [Bacteroidota bacterium]
MKLCKLFIKMFKNPGNKKVLRWSLISGGALLAVGIIVYFYFANLTYDDTAKVKSEFSVEAIPFIKEFEADYKAANKKYAEKIISVTGIITETEAADSTINIKMADTTTGSYLIFAFQQQHLDQAKTLKPGDRVTIKGSCSDGIYSEILDTYFVSFKRSTIDK